MQYKVVKQQAKYQFRMFMIFDVILTSSFHRSGWMWAVAQRRRGFCWPVSMRWPTSTVRTVKPLWAGNTWVLDHTSDKHSWSFNTGHAHLSYISSCVTCGLMLEARTQLIERDTLSGFSTTSWPASHVTNLLLKTFEYVVLSKTKQYYLNILALNFLFLSA